MNKSIVGGRKQRGKPVEEVGEERKANERELFNERKKRLMIVEPRFYA